MARKKTREVVPITEAVGYIRVSTIEQGKSGLGLEAQRAKIETYCALREWRLRSVHVESFSGKTLTRRPDLQAAIAELCPGRILLAYKLDRLTRTARDLDDLTELLEARGSGWATIEGNYDTSSAMGRMLIRIVADIAQGERELIAERTTEALEALARRGGRLGATPLGYVTHRVDGVPHVQEDPEGQETVRLARSYRAQGLSYRKIAHELTNQGRLTKRGSKWEATTVKRLIEPRYLERNPHA